jgi:hypothetical protein
MSLESIAEGLASGRRGMEVSVLGVQGVLREMDRQTTTGE